MTATGRWATLTELENWSMNTEPQGWVLVQVNDGTPDATAGFTSPEQAESALIDLLAEMNDIDAHTQSAEMYDTCTRTEHPNGAVTWDDGDCWQAYIAPVWVVVGAAGQAHRGWFQ